MTKAEALTKKLRKIAIENPTVSIHLVYVHWVSRPTREPRAHTKAVAGPSELDAALRLSGAPDCAVVGGITLEP